MVTLDEQLVREAQRRARFIVATNVLDHGDLAGEEATGLYKAQSGVERGMAFLKDPLVLASSMVVKKPERIMTLSLIMVVCLVVYRLAEWRLRQAVAHTERTVPTPSERCPSTSTSPLIIPRCVACWSASKISIYLGTSRGRGSTEALVHGLLPLHALVVAPVGPAVLKLYT